jgi:hypothetical protein
MQHHVRERRRHTREALTCPAALRDKAGRVLVRGRAVDVSPCGIRIIGPARSVVRDNQNVWVELHAPNTRMTGPRYRVVKMKGRVRRSADMGDWRSVVVVFESDFSRTLLSPAL